MSITARWDNAEKTVLIVTVKGKWTGNNALEQALDVAAQVPHPVYAIVDFRFAGWMPRGPLAVSSVPPTIVAAVLLGIKPFPLGWSRTIYAGTMQEAKQHIEHLMQGAEISTEPQISDVPFSDSQSDDPIWLLLLQPFREALAINLISYEHNGLGTYTISPFVLHTNHICVLTSSESGEHARTQANPYVKIEALETPVSQQLLALASTASLEDRTHLIAAWEHKYNQKIALLSLQSQMKGQRLLWLDLALLGLAL